MKTSRFLAAMAFIGGAGCHSLDNPLAGLNPFKTGHDARSYNAQTGEFEWPKNATPRPRTRAARAKSRDAATSPAKADERTYDPEKAEFRDPPPGR